MAAPTSTPTSMVTSHQQFTVEDWDAVLPLMQSLLDQTAAMEDASHYDWTKSDNQVMFRSTFSDADALLRHYDAIVGPILENLLAEGVASQDRHMLAGPPSELEKIQSRVSKLDADYFESADGFQTGFVNVTGADNAEMAAGHGTLCTTHPSFKVTDWNSAGPLMRELIDTTCLEKGCTYFGWASKDEELSWHANFVSGSALREHFENVKPILQALTAGPATLVRLELHGPSAELDKARAATDGLDHVFRYESDHRVSRLVQRFGGGVHAKQS